MSLLGIDVGTTGCKAAISSEEGISSPSPMKNTTSKGQSQDGQNWIRLKRGGKVKRAIGRVVPSSTDSKWR